MDSWRRPFWRWEMYRYHIGNLQFCWKDGNFPLVQDEFMERYIVLEDEGHEENETITYESFFSDFAACRTMKLLRQNDTYELYQAEQGKMIVYHWAACRFGFGYWMEELEKGNKIKCYFHPDMEKQIPLSAVRFFSCAGMHSKLLQHGNLVLHASYINWNGQAIIFTAPSGTGKSTQAALWQKYEGAEIINGDRALLGKSHGIWYSYGYPCCGSSAICINRTFPLSMIVVLEQGDRNQVLQMTNSQKIRAIAAGAEVFLWDAAEINCVFMLAEQLIYSVPVIKLICRPDEDAVNVLKNYWKENVRGKSI